MVRGTIIPINSVGSKGEHPKVSGAPPTVYKEYLPWANSEPYMGLGLFELTVVLGPQTMLCLEALWPKTILCQDIGNRVFRV